MGDTAAMITGENLLGYSTSGTGERVFHAVNPATGETLPGDFHEATEAELDRAMACAEAAFPRLKRCPGMQIASGLDGIADEIEQLDELLISRAHQETGLPLDRLRAERTRTINQARMFAQLARDGAWRDEVVDVALPDRKPIPRPHLRRANVPIGPVVVFGASNFPLAISVASCDTLSALAVGCPVIVKAHPAHPGTSELVGRVITRALHRCDLPEGAFSLVQGLSPEISLRLTRDPRTRAVAFTGSHRAGRALFDAAAARPNPIPVYAEMESLNPVFVFASATTDAHALASGFVQSMTQGVGQFCTKPGVLFVLNDGSYPRIREALRRSIAEKPAGVMLTKSISEAYRAGVECFRCCTGVHVLAEGPRKSEWFAGAAAILFETNARTFMQNPELQRELFGPASIVVLYDSYGDMLNAARRLEGQLTASFFGSAREILDNNELVDALEAKAGRLIFNAWPTGVEVCQSMQHGGNYPAATHSGVTSIGLGAYKRFVRPVCFQNAPVS